MTLVAYDNLTGKIHKADDILLAEKVIQERKDKDPWQVITDLVNAWANRSPDEFKAFKVHLQDMRTDLKDKKFGQTSGGKDMDRRLTMIFPQSLMFMIRSVYKSDELKMDKAFYHEFLRRFPFFRVPERI